MMIELSHAISMKSQKISEYYGEKQELEKLIEECAEVIHAAQKYKDNRTAETLDNLCEEIADTLAVAERCLFLMDVDPDEIQGIIDAKTDRQIERIQKAGGAKEKVYVVDDWARAMIKRLLKEKGVTQKELAQKMGITPIHLSNIIQGKVRLTRKNADKMAHELKTDEREFMLLTQLPLRESCEKPLTVAD